jgi:ribosome-associated protein
MAEPSLIARDLEKECRFTATRSSGPGGQNVNKVSTRVALRFDIAASELLTAEEKSCLVEKLGNRLVQDTWIVIVCQTERTQLGNKKKAYQRFLVLLERALTPERIRIRTRPSSASRQKRLDDKRHRSLTKSRRSSGE